MAVHLKTLVVGDSGTGKTETVKSLSNGKKNGNCFEAPVFDAASRTQITFSLKESTVLPMNLNQTVWILIFYDITNRDSWSSVVNHWMPEVQDRITSANTFVMILGTHCDWYNREVPSEEAEEFSSENSAFHMEISSPMSKNIELTLKLMKIRSLHILKKFPQMRSSTTGPDCDLVNMSSPTVVQNRTNGSVREISIESSPPLNEPVKAHTPQFSGKNKKSHVFESIQKSTNFEYEPDPLELLQVKEDIYDQSDMPMAYEEYNKRKHRYADSKSFASTVAGEMIATFDNKKLNLAENMSFANMSEISNQPEESSFIDHSEQIFGESIDRNCLKLHNLPRPPSLNSGSNTERRARSPMGKSQHNTDRPGREVLLHLNCTFSANHRQKIEVYEGDSAFDIAERLHPQGDQDALESMAGVIEEKINNYLLEISRSMGKDIIGRCLIELDANRTENLFVMKGDSPSELARNFCESHDLGETWESRIQNIVEEEYGEDLWPNLLFKINIVLHGQNQEIQVCEDDDLEEIAADFSEQHNLEEGLQSQILSILKEAANGANMQFQMANPLMARPAVGPTGHDPAQDLVNRYAASTNPAVALIAGTAESVLSAMSRARQHKTSAAVNLAVDEGDKLPLDFVEPKEPLESILFSVFNNEPEDSSIYTYVENLKTGKFSKYSDNSLVPEMHKPSEYTPVSQELMEKRVYLRLENWSRRLHKIFILAMGLLAGVCLLHLYLVFWNTDNVKFLKVYASLSRVVAGMIHILIVIAVVGSYHMLSSESKHFKKISSTMVDYDTEKHRLPYYVAWFCFICYVICFVITAFNAMFVNKMYYEDAKDPEQWDRDGVESGFGSQLTMWSLLSCIRAILVIVVWIVINSQNYWNVGTLYAMKIEEIERKEVHEEFGADVYRHLFWGNPYLPSGIFQIGEEESLDTDDDDEKEDAGRAKLSAREKISQY